jgi:hypothetical protein
MLVARAFGAKRADETHRVRLRVEVGRLRAVFRALADVVHPSAEKLGAANRAQALMTALRLGLLEAPDAPKF